MAAESTIESGTEGALRIQASQARKHGRAISDRVMEWLIRGNAGLVVLSVVLIFAFLIKESLPFFQKYGVGSLLSGRVWEPVGEPEVYGALSMIAGTLLTTVVAILLALPFGVLCAVFMSEIAPPRLKGVLKSTVEILAGIPSVVIGFVGMTIVAPLMQDRLHLLTGLTAFTGSALLAFMALPTIISISEDALHAVPRDFRQASLALGATRLQTIWKSVVPAAGRGIVAAMMLGVGRAVGETMTVLMVTGNARNVPTNFFTKDLSENSLFQSVRTLTATIAAEMGEVARGSDHYHALFALGAVLFLITFVINSIADYALNRGRR